MRPLKPPPDNDTPGKILAALARIDRTLQQPRPSDKRRRLKGWLDDDAITALLETADTATALAILLMCDAGCRLREALAFDVRSLSADLLRIYATKTSRWRSVPITPRLDAAIIAAMSGLPPQARPLAHMNSRAMQRKLTQLCIAAATSLTTPHRLRHSYATRLSAEHVPLHLISALLGHKNLTTTLLYIHGSESEYNDAKQALARRAQKALARRNRSRRGTTQPAEDRPTQGGGAAD